MPVRRAVAAAPSVRAATAALLLISCSAGSAREGSPPRREGPAAPAPVAGSPARRAPVPSLQAFWTAFRKAALAGDAAAVAAMTRFPFKTRGELDGDPWVQHGREAFAAVFSRLLQQDTGLAAEEEPLRRLIERTPTLDEGAAGSARLAALLFELVDGRWMLTAAYLAE